MQQDQMKNQPLAISPCETPEHSDSRTSQLIREWLFRFGVEHKEDVAPRLPLWLEAFGGMDAETLERLFRRALRDCKFFPRVADILEPLKKTQEAHVPIEAEQKWQQVLSYAQTTSPDYPSRPIRIKEQTQAAIRAAGGLDWIRDCPEDDLQWAKKRFVESFVSWSLLEKNQYLLPDGELKNLIARAAQKLLPEAKP